MLWAETSGCPPYQAGIDLSIAGTQVPADPRRGCSPRRVSLHDLQHDYVKGTHPDLAEANTQLLEAYRASLPRRLGERGPTTGISSSTCPIT